MNGGESEESLGALMAQLADDGRAYARAEVAYYREVALARVALGKWGVIFGIVALLLAHAAVIALVVGGVLTLAPTLGPGFATLAVVVLTLVIAGVLGKLAATRISRAMEPVE